MGTAAHAAERGAYKALCRWHMHVASIHTRRGNRTDVEALRRAYYDLAAVGDVRARWYVTDAEYSAILTETPRAPAALAEDSLAAKAYFRATYPGRFAA